MENKSLQTNSNESVTESRSGLFVDSNNKKFARLSRENPPGSTSHLLVPGGGKGGSQRPSITVTTPPHDKDVRDGVWGRTRVRLRSWTPKPCIYHATLFVIVPALVWAVLFFLFQHLALPSGVLFSLFIIEFVGLGLGFVLKIVKLPPLVGMLAVGIMLRNVPYIDYASAIPPHLSSILRQIALVVILIRGGLSLDPEALMRMKGMVLRLAFLPCLAEATTCGLIGHFLLSIPFAWSFLLGFVLAAVSPAVVVPNLLYLQERGYGVEKGIPTIVMAAASVDDILAISFFGITLGFALSSSQSLVESIFQGPLEFIMGITFSLILGAIGGFIFSRYDSEDHSALPVRAFYLLFGGTFAVFGSQYIHYPGAGALGCLGGSFVSSVIWRAKGVLWDDDPLCRLFAFFWFFLEPILFGLIGCEIDVRNLDGRVVLFGSLTLLIALVIRLGVSYFAVSRGNLNLPEKIFISIAWIPKATVQAAIGSVALDTARKLGSKEGEALGLIVLTVAVLSILITAPIGAALIIILGPRLLKRQELGSHRNSAVEAIDLEIPHNVTNLPSRMTETEELLSIQLHR